MTQGQRILLNTAASYARTVVSIALGLLSGRWILAALGVDDVGLFGAVGASMFFLQFFNNVLAGAVARFYAYALGSAGTGTGDGTSGDVSAWFNAAVRIHFVLAFAIALAVYPVALHALRHWLNVPPERMAAAIAVLRLAVAGSVVSMCAAPWLAMYTARQWIAELSFFQLLQSIALAAGSWLLLGAGGDRLVLYAVLSVVVYSAIPVVQAVRARFAFRECRLARPLFPDWKRTAVFFSYAGWNLFGSFMSIAQGQGMALLIKRHLPLASNAAFSYAGQVTSHGNTLGQALSNAMAPAITTFEGSGDRERAVALSFRACKFCTILLLVVVVPLGLEIGPVVELWLKSPPPGTADLCILLFTALFFRNMTLGQTMAVSASGKIAAFQAAVGTLLGCSLPVAWLFMRAGGGLLSVGYATAVASFVGAAVRTWFGWKIVGMSPADWVKLVAVPCCAVAAAGLGAGCAVVRLLDPSVSRIFATTAASVAAMSVSSWMFLEKDERAWVAAQFSAFRRRVLP